MLSMTHFPNMNIRQGYEWLRKYEFKIVLFSMKIKRNIIDKLKVYYTFPPSPLLVALNDSHISFNCLSTFGCYRDWVYIERYSKMYLLLLRNVTFWPT